MSLSPIRYVSFDCYGTLIDFQVGNVARDRLAARVPAGRMTAFLDDFRAYRFDEVLGAWKPYPEVLYRSLERTCRRWGIAFDPADAQAIAERAAPQLDRRLSLIRPAPRRATAGHRFPRTAVAETKTDPAQHVSNRGHHRTCTGEHGLP